MHRSVHIQETKKGPRYCPSLEAKILRFDRDAHTVWLEPEGYDSGVFFDVCWSLGCLTLGRRDISEWDLLQSSGGSSGTDDANYRGFGEC